MGRKRGKDKRLGRKRGKDREDGKKERQGQRGWEERKARTERVGRSCRSQTLLCSYPLNET